MKHRIESLIIDTYKDAEDNNIPVLCFERDHYLFLAKWKHGLERHRTYNRKKNTIAIVFDEFYIVVKLWKPKNGLWHTKKQMDKQRTLARKIAIDICNSIGIPLFQQSIRNI